MLAHCASIIAKGYSYCNYYIKIPLQHSDANGTQVFVFFCCGHLHFFGNEKPQEFRSSPFFFEQDGSRQLATWKQWRESTSFTQVWGHLRELVTSLIFRGWGSTMMEVLLLPRGCCPLQLHGWASVIYWYCHDRDHSDHLWNDSNYVTLQFTSLVQYLFFQVCLFNLVCLLCANAALLISMITSGLFWFINKGPLHD